MSERVEITKLGITALIEACLTMPLDALRDLETTIRIRNGRGTPTQVCLETLIMVREIQAKKEKT